MADGLIPLDVATICLWPVSADDQRQHCRIIAGPPNAQQRVYLAERNGRATILDALGTGDARTFWAGIGRSTGWADGLAVTREFAKLDCPFGEDMRRVLRQVGEAA